jgi:hypothetical protein
MSLPYFAADTLGVSLYQVKSQLVANEVHQMFLGPWRMDLPIDVRSDVLSGVEAGFWVTLNGMLRLYVVVKEQESWLFVLNTEKLREVGKHTGFAGKSALARTVELKPAIRGVFRWKSNRWTSMPYEGAPVSEGVVAEAL